MSSDYVDIRVRLRDAATAEAQLRKLGMTTQQVGTQAEVAGQKAARGARGFSLFRRNNDLATRSLQRSTGAMMGAAKAALRLGIAYAGLGAAKKAVNVTMDLAKNTLTLSRNFDIAEQRASTLAGVLQVRGIDINKAQMSFAALSKQIEAAKSGNQAARETFWSLGISIKELRNPSNDFQDILFKVGNRLGHMEGGTKRTALASKLLARGWQTLLPLFKEGSKTFKEQIDLARKYGVTLDGKAVQSAKDLIAAQRELKYAQLGFQIQFATKVVPLLLKGANAVIKLINAFRGLPPVLQDVIKVGVAALIGLAFGPWGALIAAIVVGALVIKKNWGVIAPFFKDIWNKVVGYLRTAFNFIKNLLRINNADLARFARGVRNAVMFVLGVLRLLARIWIWAFRNVMLPVIRRVAPGVKALIQGIARVIGGFVKLVGGLLTGKWSKAWEGAKQIVRGALKGIGGIIRASTAPIRAAFAFVGRVVATAATGAFNGVKEAFKAAINWIIDKWNGIEFRVPSVKVLGETVIPGVTIGTPDLPRLALGGVAMRRGAALVGERGPELLDLPAGARVRPLTSPERMAPIDLSGALGGDGGTRVIQLVVDRRVLTEAVDRGVGDKRARGRGRR